MIWVMLNPSTADANQDDPTIRRCVGFATRHGCGAIDVLNLYAFRTAKPVALAAAIEEGIDIEGPENAFHWGLALAQAEEDTVVAAWGSNARQIERIGVFSKALASMQPWSGWKCLGFNEGGTPKHPLFVRAETELVPL